MELRIGNTFPLDMKLIKVQLKLDSFRSKQLASQGNGNNTSEPDNWK